jgi:choice-of-anchor A domain-containing protein
MKFAPISRLWNGLLFATVAVLLNIASVAFADQFGCGTAPDWQRWTVFVQGQGVTKGTTVLSLSGGAYIHGDAGVWGPGSVSVNSALSGVGSQIDDLYIRTGDTVMTSGGAVVHHLHPNSNPILAPSSAELVDESNCLAAMTDTGGYTWQSDSGPIQSSTLTNINTGQNFTIKGTSPHIVLNLQNFILAGGTFTLQGTATTTFVFNVSKTFSLAGGAKIVLADMSGTPNSPTGVQASNVIFNVKGTGTDVSIGGNSQFQGILLANNRNVNINGGSVKGEVIGNKVTLGGGVQLTHASP